jgi:hypothetical protein
MSASNELYKNKKHKTLYACTRCPKFNIQEKLWVLIQICGCNFTTTKENKFPHFMETRHLTLPMYHISFHFNFSDMHSALYTS